MTVIYPGEINENPRQQWIRSIEVFDENLSRLRQFKLFCQHPLPECAHDGIRIKASWSNRFKI